MRTQQMNLLGISMKEEFEYSSNVKIIIKRGKEFIYLEFQLIGSYNVLQFLVKLFDVYNS